MSGPTSAEESLGITQPVEAGEEHTMFYDNASVRAENEYRREQLTRAYRPLLTLRAAQALTRNRIKRSERPV